MTKNIIDNAICMNAMRGFDQTDAASKELVVDYFKNGFKQKLKGRRLGVIKSLLTDSIYSATVGKLRRAGAELIEITPPEVALNGFLTLLNIDMKNDLPKYLAADADEQIAVTSVKDVIAFNLKDSLLRAPYGQQLFEGIVEDTTTLAKLEIIKTNLTNSGRKYFQALKNDNLEAILSINNYHSGFAAVANHPTLTVPMGYKNSGEPISLTFIGTPLSERILLEIGYAFEQLTKVRKIPKNYQ
tara:strand:- start:3 stop:731 length:729 start_codon:yes stop_codon:yes gene_type:complete